MMVVNIDPGTTYSAYVILKDGEIYKAGKVRNEELFLLINRLCRLSVKPVIVIEQVKAYSVTGDTTVWTVWWYGRFHERLVSAARTSIDIYYVPRSTVKSHVTGMTSKAKDKHVRMALIDRWGPQTYETDPEEQAKLPKAKRRKTEPGPTHLIKSDMWAALAVGSWFIDQPKEELSQYTAENLMETLRKKPRKKKKSTQTQQQPAALR